MHRWIVKITGNLSGLIDYRWFSTAAEYRTRVHMKTFLICKQPATGTIYRCEMPCLYTYMYKFSFWCMAFFYLKSVDLHFVKSE